MEQADNAILPAQDAHAPAEAAQDFDRRRRDALVRLGLLVGYAAPVTVATLSMKANATSFVDG